MWVFHSNIISPEIKSNLDDQPHPQNQMSTMYSNEGHKTLTSIMMSCRFLVTSWLWCEFFTAIPSHLRPTASWMMPATNFEVQTKIGTKSRHYTLVACYLKLFCSSPVMITTPLILSQPESLIDVKTWKQCGVLSSHGQSSDYSNCYSHPSVGDNIAISRMTTQSTFAKNQDCS